MEKKVSHKIWLSCQKATELIDKKTEIRLSFGENIQLQFHKCICDACRQYEKQSSILSDLILQHFQKIEFEEIQPVSNDMLKTRILKQIRESE